MESEKKYYKEGDVVTLRQNLPNKPTMVVEKVDRIRINRESESKILIGITCIWFDKNQGLHKHRFNFKDLEPVRK